MVREHAGRHSLSLDPQAARYLAEYLGDEIGNLPGVLEQLRAVHGPGARLDEGVVTRLFQGQRHGFQWDITDALDRGDAAAALEYVHGALDHVARRRKVRCTASCSLTNAGTASATTPMETRRP